MKQMGRLGFKFNLTVNVMNVRKKFHTTELFT